MYNSPCFPQAIREKKTKYEVTFDNNAVVKVKENHILHVLNEGRNRLLMLRLRELL